MIFLFYIKKAILRVTLLKYIIVSLSKQWKNTGYFQWKYKVLNSQIFMTYVCCHMSDVEILYKALEFTFSMTYKTTAKYQPIVFPRLIYSISEISQFKCK